MTAKERVDGIELSVEAIRYEAEKFPGMYWNGRLVLFLLSEIDRLEKERGEILDKAGEISAIPNIIEPPVGHGSLTKAQMFMAGQANMLTRIKQITDSFIGEWIDGRKG